MTEKKEELLKICCVGRVSDLKTKFIQRFVENKFESNYLPTLGVDITTKRIELEGKRVKLILVEAAGEEEFRENSPSFYRGASALIIFFDKGDRQSFTDIREWKEEFEIQILSPIPMAIVAKAIKKTTNTIFTLFILIPLKISL